MTPNKEFEILMREHVKHQWNYSMNMTVFNVEQARNSTQRIANFKANHQQAAKNFELYYKQDLNSLEIRQMMKILHIGEGKGWKNFFCLIIFYWFLYLLFKIKVSE